MQHAPMTRRCHFTMFFYFFFVFLSAHVHTYVYCCVRFLFYLCLFFSQMIARWVSLSLQPFFITHFFKIGNHKKRHPFSFLLIFYNQNETFRWLKCMNNDSKIFIAQVKWPLLFYFNTNLIRWHCYCSLPIHPWWLIALSHRPSRHILIPTYWWR
jgi:hypothetical protein